MTHLRDVKMIKDYTLLEFDPMKETLELLKRQGVHLGGTDLFLELEQSKAKLEEVSEKALGPVKEMVIPIQTQEAESIKKRIKEFAKRVDEFREEFKNTCPYHTEVVNKDIIDEAYRTIGEYYDKMVALQDEAAEFNNLETLFEI